MTTSNVWDNQVQPATAQEVEQILRSMVVETLMLDGVSPADLEADKPGFIMALGASSIDTLELIISVEERLGFEFEDHELRPELLETLSHFRSEVCKKLGIPD
jgi:acyl carrier protein